MMRAPLLRRLFLLAALTAAVAPAAALELVYPADGSYVTRSAYLVIKGGTRPLLDGISIEINHIKSDVIDLSNPRYRAAFGDFLVVEPIFDPSENQIVIEGYVAGKVVASSSATVYFHSDPLAPPPDGYRPAVMHLPETEAQCVACHQMNPDAKALDGDAAESSPCADCHARRLARKHVHGPVGVYQCVTCHDPGSAPAKYQVREPSDAVLCGDCHRDKFDEFGRFKFIHGPVESGLCQVCHDAHATDHPAQLLKPVNELCLDCHQGVDTATHVLRGVGSGSSHPLQGEIDPSTPGRAFGCVSCHNPHGGAAKQYFVRNVTNRMLLCQVCHQK